MSRVRDLADNNIVFVDGISTLDITENNNLFFTNARADARISLKMIDEDNMSSNSSAHMPTQQSVKSYVDTEVSGLVDTAPSTLDTLNELAAALGDDANFSTTVTNSIATKLPLAGGTMTGNIAHAGDFTIDAGGDIILDAGGAQLRFHDDGTDIGVISNESNNLIIKSQVSNADLIFKGNDGGVGITALTLDMSEAGAATFNSNVTAGRFIQSDTAGNDFYAANFSRSSTGTVTPDIWGTNNTFVIGTSSSTEVVGFSGANAQFYGNLNVSGSIAVTDSSQIQLGSGNDMQIYHNGSVGEINCSTGDFTIDAAGDIILDAGGSDIQFKNGGVEFGRVFGSSNNFYIQSRQTDKDMIFQGVDGGSTINALTLDMSEAGAATFNSIVKIPDFIEHLGDSNSLFGFPGGDEFKLELAGVERMTMNGTGTTFNNDSADRDFRVKTASSDQMLVVDSTASKVLVAANNTASVTNSATALAARVFEVNGNASEGSDNLSIFAMADGTGNYGIEVSNSGHTAQYDLLLNPIMGGNVGIGTSSPTANLVVTQSGNTPTSGFSSSQWQGCFVNTGTTTSIARVGIYSGNATAALLNFGDADDADIGGLSYDNSENSLAIRTNNAEHVRIKNDGKVGIGTTAPEGALHLHNHSSQYAELILERDSSGVEAKFDIKPYAGSLYIREYTTSGNNSTNDIIQITDTGHFLPVSTSQNIGSTAKPWQNIYTQDMHLSNESRDTGNEIDGTKGNWTIQEGSEDLYIINNKSGKRFRFKLEELD